MTIGDSPDDRDAPRVPLGEATRRLAVAFVEAVGADDAPRGRRGEELTGAVEPGAIVPLRADKVAWVVDELEHWTSAGSVSIRLGFRSLFWALEFLPPFLVGRWSRASRLPLAERVAFLEAAESSRFGLLTAAMIGLKVPLVSLLFEEGEELHDTGFDRATTVTPRRVALPLAPSGAVTGTRS
jgi:hypothetical protein